MSTDLVKNEIQRFLLRDGAEVLCVRGKWGVGKTYTWNQAIAVAQGSGKIALGKYSYVSLFGVSSLDELKLATSENVVMLKDGVPKPNLETLYAFVNSKVGPGKNLTKIARSIPFVQKFVGTELTTVLSFMAIRDQIVCIDDLERRGEKLKVRDVLGLISYLREQRNCKIVLILNDEQLQGEKESFEKNLEKVVDKSLVYAPTAAESAAVAIKETDDASKLVRDRCITLGITNVRAIRRITRVVEDITPLLKEFDKEVFNAVASSLALFSWANDEPGEAPTLDFLKKRLQDEFGLGSNKEIPPAEAAWNALLDSYGYAWTDDLDLALMRGVKNGHVDPDKIKTLAQGLQDKLRAQKADGLFEEAWRSYHDSFENNQDEVLDKLYASFMKGFPFITPTNLSGTVSLFKELGRPEQAKEMLKTYMENRNEDRAFFDLEESPFGENVTDPDVRAAFKERYAEVDEKRDISTMLRSLKDGWTDDTIAALSTLPVEEFRKAFKSAKGTGLRRMLAGALQFDRTVNASEAMKGISRRAKQALALIGKESPINARRVRRLGVVDGEVE